MKQTDSRITDMMNFLDGSPCNFLAVSNIAKRLEAEGFTHLDQRDKWNLTPGGKYYVTQNDSAIFGFIVGTEPVYNGYKIITAHSDSPGFRIKPAPEMLCDGNILKLNTEVYGGPILYTWFDRPLSIAGRVILRSNDPLHPVTRLVKFDSPLLTIPHLAIHYNRSVNDGNPLSRQKDMLPVIAHINDTAEKDGYILNLVAKELGVEAKEILDFDLTLYDTTPACLVGVNNEFLTSGRIDDLSMAYSAMVALLDSTDTRMTRVMAIFDNEETGSETKQGACSPVLTHILQRINSSLGGDDETYMRAVAASFMVSADNGHATHPNYPEKQDPTNHPVLGGGPVIKINANCKYMSDADSAAVFRTICEDAGVPYQYFVNHSDVAGGSTLGNKLTAQINLRGVDMGAAQWAMHSVRETASAQDMIYIVRAFTQFFNA
ncbi:MAG: M18 family aminopeptidase [Muribaculaceae bacterium]